MTTRATLKALTLMVVLLCLPAVAGAETVRIGWLRAPDDITLARARGSLEKVLAAQGVAVEWSGPFAAAAPAIEAMNAGAIDITAGSSTSSITALAAGVPMVIFAYQAMSPGSEAILVPQGSPIRTLRDLVQMSDIAHWYVFEKLVPRTPDLAAGVVQLN